MNKRFLIVAVVIAVIIVAGVSFYAVKTGVGKKSTGVPATAVQQMQPAAHQGHTVENGGPATKAAVPEQPQAEAPTVEISTDSQKLIVGADPSVSPQDLVRAKEAEAVKADAPKTDEKK